MPQLDFIIAFPQIFWLVVSFILLYGIIVHFFLPFIIKSLQVRKQVVIKNNELLFELEESFSTKQKSLISLLNKNFIQVKSCLMTDIMGNFLVKPYFNLDSIDKKLILVLYYNVVYYDSVILESIPLKPNLFD